MASGGRSATGAVFTSSDNASVYFPTTEGLWAESITCNKVKFPFLIILGNRKVYYLVLSCLRTLVLQPRVGAPGILSEMIQA